MSGERARAGDCENMADFCNLNGLATSFPFRDEIAKGSGGAVGVRVRAVLVLDVGLCACCCCACSWWMASERVADTVRADFCVGAPVSYALRAGRGWCVCIIGFFFYKFSRHF